MNVLTACEESQRVAMSFRDKGHYAFSCDVLPCSWVSGGSKKPDDTPRINLGKTRNSKLRSKTFWGVAKAMADQWG